MAYDDPAQPITAVLDRCLNNTDFDADDRRVFAEIHQLMRELSQQLMAEERAQHTLGATGLASEAYLKLRRSSARPWRDRNEFRRYVASVMRSILIDYTRARQAAKRGGGQAPQPLDEAKLEEKSQDFSAALAVYRVIDQLGRHRPRSKAAVDCIVFAGLTLEESAECLGTSRATLSRDWAYARDYLRRALGTN